MLHARPCALADLFAPLADCAAVLQKFGGVGHAPDHTPAGGGRESILTDRWSHAILGPCQTAQANAPETLINSPSPSSIWRPGRLRNRPTTGRTPPPSRWDGWAG